VDEHPRGDIPDMRSSSRGDHSVRVSDVAPKTDAWNLVVEVGRA
jgi:hypothetical protein